MITNTTYTTYVRWNYEIWCIITDTVASLDDDIFDITKLIHVYSLLKGLKAI